MIINNKQPKTTPAFSSENAFNNNRSIYLRLLAWIPALFVCRRDLLVLLKAGRRIHGNERFREPPDPADRDEIRLFPRGSDAICRPHRTHEFPGTENRPHDRISGLLRHGPLRTPFFVPDPRDLRRRLFAAFVIVFCYACTDEFHMLSSPAELEDLRM